MVKVPNLDGLAFTLSSTEQKPHLILNNFYLPSIPGNPCAPLRPDSPGSPFCPFSDTGPGSPFKPYGM